MRTHLKTKTLNKLALACALSTVAGACSKMQGNSALDAIKTQATETTYGGAIRLSLVHPFDVKNDDFEMLASTPTNVDSLAICEIKDSSPCAPGSPTFYKANLTYATADHRFFRSNASALMETGLVLRFVAYDAAGKSIDERTVQFVKAGETIKPAAAAAAAANAAAATAAQPAAGSVVVSGGANAGGGALPDPNAAATAVDPEVKSIVQNNCGGGTCHHAADYVSHPELLKSAPDAVQRIDSGNMPQNSQLSDDDRQTLLDYLAQ